MMTCILYSSSLGAKRLALIAMLPIISKVVTQAECLRLVQAGAAVVQLMKMMAAMLQ
jgi:hypothetical protein